MAWTAPMTAVANDIFTAAQFNTHVRDNLLETSPGKATTVGSHFVTSGTNTISERITSSVEVLTSETTASITYVGLTTPCAVTVNTGTKALVIISAQMSNGTAGINASASIAVSGSTTIAAADSNSISFRQASGLTGQNASVSRASMYALTPGSNTFTMQYKSSSANASTFFNRNIVVIPF